VKNGQIKNFSIMPVLLWILVACQTAPKKSDSRTVEDIHLRLSVLERGLERYQKEGPFSYTELYDAEIPVSADEKKLADVFRTTGKGVAPVLIFSHGNYSGKRAHREQARRLASWGFHVVVLDLPNRDQWLQNAKRLADTAGFLHRWPKYLGDNVDSGKIMLVGHSFGGSAAILAAGYGAPVAGVILLDPAVVHPSVQVAMAKVNCPVVLLGADPKVFKARGRSNFRRKIASEFVEISVKGATHDDAQSPSMYSRYTLGLDPFTSDVNRAAFSASIVSSAISISTHGNLEQFRMDIAPLAASGSIETVFSRR
jgi:dienelactone hydrolase